LRQVLEQYPRDRVVHDDLGHILFLQRRYADAVKEFDSTLAIDPEDLEANYNLMLCYTGMGQPDRAAEFQKRYLRFKADESAQTITGPYRQSHPEDNLERQPIHEHTSVCVEGVPGCAPERKISAQALKTNSSAAAHSGKASD
jgi:tetratricopeptide (TPR) repeat protein